MILILSRESAESTTEAIIDWLKFYNKDYYRFNGEDLFNGNSEIKFYLEDGVWGFVINSSNGIQIKSKDITSVWFRRAFDFNIDSIIDIKPDNIKEYDIIKGINNYHRREAFAVFSLIERSLCDRFWLNRPSDINDKLLVLAKAQNCGLRIPPTMVTNSKPFLYDFLKTNSFVITKACTDGKGFKIGEDFISGLTEKVDYDSLSNCPGDIFFPSLFQSGIVKKYEVRSFFIDGDFFSVAIFSQLNEKTRLDYREYDEEFPNRAEVIKLPLEIENALKSLMNSLNINCGSIDLIKAEDDTYYFLEINPVGQFLGISENGNLNLDKILAEKLIEESNKKLRNDT